MNLRPCWLMIALLAAGGCGSRAPKLSGPHGDGAAGTFAPSEGGAGTGGAGTSGAGTGGLPDGGTPDAGSSVADWVPIRHLTNYEYTRSIKELLGLSSPAESTFEADDLEPTELGAFDVLGASIVTNARYEQWFDSAETLAAAAFADPEARARIVTCQPAGAVDTECAKTIVSAFGLRAWRRPLTTDERDQLVSFSTAARTAGATFDESIQRVVTAVLSSAPFLYRMEIDPDPAAKAPRALTGHELASRLSFLLWSSGPDARLLQLAGDGTLVRTDVLRAEVDRMVDDARSLAFAESFGGNWLGTRELAKFGSSASLRKSITGELTLYVNEFLRGNRSLGEFPNAEVNYIDQNLAGVYGLSAAGISDDFQRVEVTTDARRGYLGLAAALTAATTAGNRASPTLRGQWLLSRLLCAPPAAPPIDTPDGPRDLGPNETDRSRASAIQANAACAGCHHEMDGLGMALAGFDFAGRYLGNLGQKPDDQGWLADGTPLDGEPALADAVARDPRFLPCFARQTMRFALNRELDRADQPSVDNVVARWKRGVPTLRALLEEIVLDDSFRMRLPEGMP